MNWVIPMNAALLMVLRQIGRVSVGVLFALELYGTIIGIGWLVDFTAATALTILAGLYLIEHLR